jgi:hypothetical protein
MDDNDDSINKKVKLMPTKSNMMKLLCSSGARLSSH